MGGKKGTYTWKRLFLLIANSAGKGSGRGVLVLGGLDRLSSDKTIINCVEKMTVEDGGGVEVEEGGYN